MGMIQYVYIFLEESIIKYKHRNKHITLLLLIVSKLLIEYI